MKPEPGFPARMADAGAAGGAATAAWSIGGTASRPGRTSTSFEKCVQRPRSLSGDPAHLSQGWRGEPAAGADEDAKQVAGRAGVAQRAVRTLVGDSQAPAQEREAVALEGRQQDPREVERVEDQPRPERLGEQRSQEEQVEGAAVGDQRGVAAEIGEPRGRLGRRRAAEDVVVGEADEALDGEGDRHLRIDDHLELVDRTHRLVVAHRADLEDAIAARREPGGLEVEGDEMVQVRWRPGHAARRAAAQSSSAVRTTSSMPSTPVSRTMRIGRGAHRRGAARGVETVASAHLAAHQRRVGSSADCRAAATLGAARARPPTRRGRA